MVNDHSPRKIVRFGMFEADLEQAELRRAGVLVKLQAQPFKVLTLQDGSSPARKSGDSRGDGTFVDFEQSVGAVVRRLRLALGDSASVPRYVETLRNRGYRFLMPTQTEGVPCDCLPVSAAEKPRASADFARRWLSAGVTGTIGLLLILLLRSQSPSAATTLAPRGVDRPAKHRPRDINAYIAFQKGRYLWNLRTAAAVEKSIRYFQKAVDLDPDYARAYAGLANSYVLLNFYTGMHRTAPIELANAASRRALRLDWSVAEAHATQAYIRFYYNWDWAGAEKSFQQAIAVDPDYGTAHQWYAEYLLYLGRFEDARREIRRAHELDPQSVVVNLQLASPDLYARNYKAAMDQIAEARQLDPGLPLGTYMLATCYEQLGRFDEAIAEYQKIAGGPMGLSGLAYAYGRSGRQPEAREILRQLLAAPGKRDVSPYHVARVYAGLGDVTEALAWLKKATDTRDERMVMVRVDPKLDTLRADPRFRTLLRSLAWQ